MLHRTVRASLTGAWTYYSDPRAKQCARCSRAFLLLRARHHCRVCGDVVCGACSRRRLPLPDLDPRPQRVCSACGALFGTPAFPAPRRVVIGGGVTPPPSPPPSPAPTTAATAAASGLAAVTVAEPGPTPAPVPGAIPPTLAPSRTPSAPLPTPSSAGTKGPERQEGPGTPSTLHTADAAAAVHSSEPSKTSQPVAAPLSAPPSSPASTGVGTLGGGSGPGGPPAGTAQAVSAPSVPPMVAAPSTAGVPLASRQLEGAGLGAPAADALPVSGSGPRGSHSEATPRAIAPSPEPEGRAPAPDTAGSRSREGRDAASVASGSTLSSGDLDASVRAGPVPLPLPLQHPSDPLAVGVGGGTASAVAATATDSASPGPGPGSGPPSRRPSHVVPATGQFRLSFRRASLTQSDRSGTADRLTRALLVSGRSLSVEGEPLPEEQPGEGVEPGPGSPRGSDSDSPTVS
jgi:hypothetical protein